MLFRSGIAGLNINFPAQGVGALTRYIGESQQLAVAAPSAGCSAASRAVPGDTTDTLTTPTHPLTTGTYLQHLPPAYDGTHALPLVLDLHGWSQTAALKLTEDGMPAYGDTHRFITVAPDITRPVPLWDTSLTGADAQWLSALLDHLEQTLCVEIGRAHV